MDRRSFIGKSALGTAGFLTAFHYPAFAQEQKLKIGLIGCGWYGMVISTAALKRLHYRYHQEKYFPDCSLC